jgi:CheY-like chemotaxis protein
MKKILIVYSNVILLSIFKRWSAHSAENILLAKNAKKALEIMTVSTIDLLITELDLPEIDGLELIAELSSLHPAVKIAFFLPADNTIDVGVLPLLGSFYFIHQPLSLKEFIHFIEPDVLGVAEFQALSIENILIKDFLQLIAYRKKTCLLEVENLHSQEKIQIYFKSGILYHATLLPRTTAVHKLQAQVYLSAYLSAVCEEFEVTSVVIQLLNWQKVTLCFKPMDKDALLRTIQASLQELIKKSNV